MKNKEEGLTNDEKFTFPTALNVQAKSIADNIHGMTAEETAKAMGEMFKNFEKQTGYKPVIVGNNSPTRVLFQDENIKPIDK